MRQAAVPARRKTVDIDRGLFLVRYASADDSRHPPMVRVSLDAGSAPDNFLVMHPDAPDALLSAPGTALAVRASSPTRLLVEVTPATEDGSTAATVKVEALNAGPQADESLPFAEAAAEVPRAAGGPVVRAHVAGIGDVVAAANEWIAGPAAPSRIEGIAVEWPGMPQALDLRYAARFQGSDVNRLASAGAFVGTRGRALPITGMVLELGGEQAEAHEIVVEALFLGVPVTRIAGRRVSVSGPTQREPLVGLRLDIARREEARDPPPRASGRTRPGQVRVFRGRSRAQAAAV